MAKKKKASYTRLNPMKYPKKGTEIVKIGNLFYVKKK